MTVFTDFPVDALKAGDGNLTWIAEYEGDAASMASIEVPVAHFELPQFSQYGDEFTDPDRGTTLLLELPMRRRSLSDLANSAYQPDSSNRTDFSGSIYLQSRHHGIDLASIQFGEPTEFCIPATFEVQLIFSHEGLFAKEGIEFSDLRWSFTSNIKLEEKVHILIRPRRWSKHWIAHKLSRVVQKRK